MKILLSNLLLVLAFSKVFAQAIPQKIDSLIAAYANLNKFNGSIVVSRGNKKIVEKSYGFRDVERNIKCNGKEIYQLASLSKSFTAVMVMRLIEEGKLTLNTPVTAFFPTSILKSRLQLPIY